MSLTGCREKGWGVGGGGRQNKAGMLTAGPIFTGTAVQRDNNDLCFAATWLPLLQGWDKTYCLQFVEEDFDTIHFFGDKTYKV